jgi:hypothetical protein
MQVLPSQRGRMLPSKITNRVSLTTRTVVDFHVRTLSWTNDRSAGMLFNRSTKCVGAGLRFTQQQQLLLRRIRFDCQARPLTHERVVVHTRRERVFTVKPMMACCDYPPNIYRPARSAGTRHVDSHERFHIKFILTSPTLPNSTLYNPI